jgi:hypothetical protein
VKAEETMSGVEPDVELHADVRIKVDVVGVNVMLNNMLMNPVIYDYFISLCVTEAFNQIRSQTVIDRNEMFELYACSRKNFTLCTVCKTTLSVEENR